MHHSSENICTIQVNNIHSSSPIVRLLGYSQWNLLLSFKADGRRNGKDSGSCVRYIDIGVRGRGPLLTWADGEWNEDIDSDRTGGIRCVANPGLAGTLLPSALQETSANKLKYFESFS